MEKPPLADEKISKFKIISKEEVIPQKVGARVMSSGGGAASNCQPPNNHPAAASNHHRRSSKERSQGGQIAELRTIQFHGIYGASRAVF